MRNTGISKKLVALGMAGMLVLTAFLVPLAEAQADGPAPSATVEVRVWQHVENLRTIHVSARPADGSWDTLGTIRLPLDDGFNSTGRYRYGDISLEVQLPTLNSSVVVEVRVWQDVDTGRIFYVGARSEGGSWDTLGTIRLPLDDGFSSTGRYRYGDISLEVPIPDDGLDDTSPPETQAPESSSPVDDQVVATPTREGHPPGSLASIDSLPWIVDGVTEGVEEWAADDLRYLSRQDRELAALVSNLPWVVDGMTEHEGGMLRDVRVMVPGHLALVREVFAFEWFHDDLSLSEHRAFGLIRFIAERYLALAWQVISEPFMQPPLRERDLYALDAFLSWATPGYEEGAARLAQLASQPWFQDGLDDNDAVLLNALANTSAEIGQSLIETHYVESAWIDLPLTGEIGVSVVRHTPFPPDDDTLETLEEGVRALEDFMDAPFPVGEVSLHLIEPELWPLKTKGQLYYSRQSYIGGPITSAALISVTNLESGPPKWTIYHELGHFYSVDGPGWFREGVAEFLGTYLFSRYSGEDLDAELSRPNEYSTCDHSGIWEHILTYEGGICNYTLGLKFMLGVYEAIGGEAVAAGLRELYSQRQFFELLDHDSIYYAFLSNAPDGKEEAFKTAYRRHHGGPTVDQVPSDSSDHAALVALYNATDGENWRNNRNWLSDAPLGAWYGVHTDSRGRVTGLHLNENGLTGELPPELGRLSTVEDLHLVSNRLGGEIPPELGNLSNLVQLFLAGNPLTGQIPPELGNLANLRNVFLQQNQLTGGIPPELANLTSLEFVWTLGNLLSGCIAPQLPEMWVRETGLERCR